MLLNNSEKLLRQAIAGESAQKQVQFSENTTTLLNSFKAQPEEKQGETKRAEKNTGKATSQRRGHGRGCI